MASLHNKQQNRDFEFLSRISIHQENVDCFAIHFDCDIRIHVLNRDDFWWIASVKTSRKICALSGICIIKILAPKIAKAAGKSLEISIPFSHLADYFIVLHFCSNDIAHASHKQDIWGPKTKFHYRFYIGDLFGTHAGDRVWIFF